MVERDVGVIYHQEGQSVPPIDQLPSQRHPMQLRPLDERRVFNWHVLVVPVAAICTAAWIIVLAMAAVWAVGIVVA